MEQLGLKPLKYIQQDCNCSRLGLSYLHFNMKHATKARTQGCNCVSAPKNGNNSKYVPVENAFFVKYVFFFFSLFFL